MASLSHTCHHCRRTFDARRWDARFCSDKCRTGANREAQVRRVVRLRELLAEQTAALDSGADPIVLADISRRAKRLLDGV